MTACVIFKVIHFNLKACLPCSYAGCTAISKWQQPHSSSTNKWHEYGIFMCCEHYAITPRPTTSTPQHTATNTIPQHTAATTPQSTITPTAIITHVQPCAKLPTIPLWQWWAAGACLSHTHTVPLLPTTTGCSPMACTAFSHILSASTNIPPSIPSFMYQSSVTSEQ